MSCVMLVTTVTLDYVRLAFRALKLEAEGGPQPAFSTSLLSPPPRRNALQAVSLAPLRHALYKSTHKFDKLFKRIPNVCLGFSEVVGLCLAEQ